MVPAVYMDDSWDWDSCREYKDVEWRAGVRGRFDIPCLPTCLAPKEEVQEGPMHKLRPVGRKFYTPIRTQCFAGADYHLYRSRRCDCLRDFIHREQYELVFRIQVI